MSKNNNPSTTDANPTENSNSSSTLKVLAQFNKETEKKELAQEAMRTRCKTCFKETSPKQLCAGHGGGGGGAGGGSSSSDDASSSNDHGLDNTHLSTPKLTPTSEVLDTPFDVTMSINPSMGSTNTSFNPKIIAELIAQGLLTISSDRNSLTLSINLQCDPQLLSKEQRVELNKYVNSIIKELDAFKKEHNISQECLSKTQNEQGDVISLQITLPTLALYDKFIQRLANNLIPEPKPELNETREQKDTITKIPSPLNMEPHPTKGENDEQSRFNPSPFSMDLKLMKSDK